MTRILDVPGCIFHAVGGKGLRGAGVIGTSIGFAVVHSHDDAVSAGSVVDVVTDEVIGVVLGVRIGTGPDQTIHVAFTHGFGIFRLFPAAAVGEAVRPVA